MFDSIFSGLTNMALKTLKEKLMSQYLDGIGVVQKLSYEKGKIFITVLLAGLEDRPIDITCSEIDIAADGGSLTVHEYESNMPFAKAALNRYATRSFAIPAGTARVAAQCVKKALGL